MTDTLSDLLSHDPNRIWQASWEVIGTRDTALLETLRLRLPRIRRATADIELGGMIRPNRDALTHALGKVQNYRTWRCWCDDYPRLLAYDPAREEERAHKNPLPRQFRMAAGVVCCEMIAVDAPHSMHYTWKGDEDSGDVTDVTYLLEETRDGTRFTWHHTGFTGVGGFAMSKLLGNVRKKMLANGVPPVLKTYHRGLK